VTKQITQELCAQQRNPINKITWLQQRKHSPAHLHANKPCSGKTPGPGPGAADGVSLCGLHNWTAAVLHYSDKNDRWKKETIKRVLVHARNKREAPLHIEHWVVPSKVLCMQPEIKGVLTR